MLYFFGDSWPAEGGELEAILHSKVKSYPAMVGDMLSMPYENHGLSGSSQLDMVSKLIASNATAGDHAIFSLTSPARRFYYNNQGIEKNTAVDTNREQLNDYQDSWLSALSCYTIYNYCSNHKITPWFINTFNISFKKQWSHPLWKFVPDHVWILPKDTCIVQMLFDPERFAAKYDDSDFDDWLQSDNQQVQQYIQPCRDHPNLKGREKIASVIAEKIKKDLI